MRARSRAILVTGADRSIGRATALRLGEHGFWVLACGEDPHPMTDLPRETAPGGLIEIHTLDPASDASCRRALERAQELFEDLDGLVWTGGTTRFGPVEETDHERLSELLDLNVLQPLQLLRPAAALFRERRRGTIVCISSAAGRVALPMSGAYSASRFALEGLCDALRLELGMFGPNVVLVEPGLVRERVAGPRGLPSSTGDLFDVEPGSPYWEVAELLTEAYRQLLRRAATPDDVAQVVERALLATRPRPRYAVSGSTAALLWARRLLPDRLLDNRVAKAVGLTGDR